MQNDSKSVAVQEFLFLSDVFAGIHKPIQFQVTIHNACNYWGQIHQSMNLFTPFSIFLIRINPLTTESYSH